MTEPECEDDVCGICGTGGVLLVQIEWNADRFFMCRSCLSENEHWFKDTAKVVE